MKTKLIFFTTRSIIVALGSCAIILSTAFRCDDSWDITDDEGLGSTNQLTLDEYFEQINEILYSDSARSDYNTAKEVIAAEAEGYLEQFKEASKLNVPDEVRSVHSDLVNALYDQYISNRSAAADTPDDLEATTENINAYSHYTADVGYARDDQSGAGCNLEEIAVDNNIAFDALGVCEANTGTQAEGKSIGTEENPVNEIYMLHDLIPTEGSETGRPNVDGFEYSSITAKAGVPINIVFDNRNPAPFVFNICVYNGNSERVMARQRVDGTFAFAGEKVHELSLTLEPGTYTYVDNVHPVAMRGTLTVVE